MRPSTIGQCEKGQHVIPCNSQTDDGKNYEDSHVLLLLRRPWDTRPVISGGITQDAHNATSKSAR